MLVPHTGEELHTLALEVIELLRAQVGREAFARAYASVQQEAQSKKLVRKRQRALEVLWHAVYTSDNPVAIGSCRSW